MDVPEPRTVTFSGVRDMLKTMETISMQSQVGPPDFRLRAGLRLGGLRRNRLIDFQIGHFQLAQKIQE
jgi:hypothetical protein